MVFFFVVSEGKRKLMAIWGPKPTNEGVIHSINLGYHGICSTQRSHQLKQARWRVIFDWI
jgi:hypothetical protein